MATVIPDDLVDAEALLTIEDMPGLTAGQIRTWACRGKISRYGYTRFKGQRRTLYSLTEIRSIYFAGSTTRGKRSV